MAVQASKSNKASISQKLPLLVKARVCEIKRVISSQRRSLQLMIFADIKHRRRLMSGEAMSGQSNKYPA